MKKINFSKINKRHLTLVGLVIVIAVAGYININYTGDAVPTMATIDESTEKEITPKVEEDVYTKAIIERDEKRSKSMNAYREIIDNQNCDRETKEIAQKMLTDAAKFINDENTIESTMRAKGIEKNVVYIDEDEVTVLIFEEKLNESQVAQIKDIITDKTKTDAQKIKIIENN